jgi:ketosteroid isomerase-like protein
VLVVLGCHRPAAGSSASDSTAVASASRDYINAWLRGDTAAALNRVASDIRILISGVPDIIGKDSARAVFTHEMATYELPLLRLDRRDLIVRGDYAIDIGTYDEIQLPKNGGAPIRNHGRYLTIWRRDDNQWRIARYMLNDLPAK